MGFTSFLKKFGQIAANVAKFTVGFAPLITTSYPKAEGVVGEILKISDCITTVETVFTAVSGPDVKTGAQKLAAATPLVAKVIQQSEIMLGKKIANEQAFTDACTKITSGFADLLNSLETNN